MGDSRWKDFSNTELKELFQGLRYSESQGGQKDEFTHKNIKQELRNEIASRGIGKLEGH